MERDASNTLGIHKEVADSGGRLLISTSQILDIYPESAHTWRSWLLEKASQHPLFVIA
jgi:hypothetical protein